MSTDALDLNPTLLFAVDDELADTAAILPASDVVDYGRNLSMDWSHIEGPRIRLAGVSGPVIVDGPQALLEDVIKILLTPRYQVPIYSDDYGFEGDELIGDPGPLAATLLPTMLEDALTQDPRILGIENLTISFESDVLRVRFAIRDFRGTLLTIPAFVVRYVR